MIDVKTLIKTFCERLGIQSEANAEGIYAFEADAFEFAVHDLSEQHRVAFVGDLGAIPAVNPEGLFRLMLEAQHCFRETEGAVFSIDRERDRLTLNRMLSCLELDNETFFNEVERFVNQLEAWACIIRDYNGKTERDEGRQGDAEMDESALDIHHRMV
jgi:ATP-dependent exoDNAse (exonuclease V) alpha subunit